MKTTNETADCHRSNKVHLDGLGYVDIRIPKDYSLREVVAAAVRRQLGIPCFTEEGDRALLTIGSSSVTNSTIKTLSITQRHLESILAL